MDAQLNLCKSLAWFLPKDSELPLSVPCPEPRSAKDLIESCGIPHPELESILVNDHPATMETLVQAGDRIEAFGPFSPVDVTIPGSLQRKPMEEPRFVADVHLGTLVRYLRLLGFDCKYWPFRDDDQLAATSEADNRIMLTRDRGLLKRGNINFGCYVRSDQPEQQMEDLLHHFALLPFIKPYSRCLSCSGVLQRVEPEVVADELPPATLATIEVANRCVDCGKLFWRGSHSSRLDALVQRFTQGLMAD